MSDDDMEDLQDTYPGAGTFKFGEDAARNAELLALVRSGKKRALCEALREFADDMGALPSTGRCDIAANWDGTPALVIKTLKVTQLRFCDVSEALAVAEGEHPTLAVWQAQKQTYLQRSGGFDPEMMLVFEQFDVVEDLANR